MQTDQLFIYSQGEVLISGQIKPINLINTCQYDETLNVFSFIQNREQLPITETTLIDNYKAQFGINSSENITMWDIQKNLSATNFTYTVIALGNLNISSQTKI